MPLPPQIAGFVVDGFEPAYLRLLESGELKIRVERAQEELRSCRACPRDCQVNRLENQKGVCATGRWALVASYFPHFGEEDCLRGWYGSGTIFFSRCNLKCVFCQNFDISRRGEGERPFTANQLADAMLYLQEQGCHNINFVTPEHVVPQVIEAVYAAARRGLRLPIVYNTSAYDSIKSLELLEGIVDIYMPDFKCWDPHLARTYLRAEDYPQVARQTIKEMCRQVGVLKFNREGLAVRGVLLRHLVMPGWTDDSKRLLKWVAEELGTDTYINIMDQYYPAGMVSDKRYPELNRRLRRSEYEEVVEYALSLGLWRLDVRYWRRYPIEFLFE